VFCCHGSSLAKGSDILRPRLLFAAHQPQNFSDFLFLDAEAFPRPFEMLEGHFRFAVDAR